MDLKQIKCSKEFWDLVSRLGLEDHELDLAYLVWRKAEECYEQPKQPVGVLLGEKPSEIKDLLTRALNAASTYNKTENKVQANQCKYAFTESELQWLHKVLVHHFQGILFIRERQRLKAAWYWSLSDKNNPETELFFDKFKLVRQNQRRSNAELHRLQNAISKIKKMIRA